MLDSVSFSLREGEVVGLVGPNGAGKSTLMKTIVGLIRNYDGTINIEGENVLNQKRKKVGCLIENPGFYPDLSGYDNLLFFSKISGSGDKTEIENVIELLGIKNFIHKKAKKYSLGMKQRLALAQAVLGNPKLLVLDEPTNGLDPNIIITIRKFIKYISEEKKVSIIISSHILSEIESMCERVIFIKNGKIIEQTSLTFNKINSENNYYVFEIEDTQILMDFLKTKNINAVIDDTNRIIANLNKYSLKEVLANLIDNNINITGVYKKKDSLEKKFLNIMEENVIE